MANGRAHAVVAGVAAADDQHPLAGGRNRAAVRKAGIQQAAGHACQVIHRKVDALRITAGDIDVAGLLGAAAKHDRIIAGLQLLGADGAANIGIKDKLDALILQNFYPAVDDPLLQLHVGDAVHQQAARAVLALIDRHLVAALV